MSSSAPVDERENLRTAQVRSACWNVYAIAALIGLFVPPLVRFTAACDYLECRQEVASWSLGLTYLAVGGTLILAGRKIVRSRRVQLKWAVIALIGVLASLSLGWVSMSFSLDGRSVLTRESRDIEAELGQMPGVQRVSTESGKIFSTVVVLTEDASAAQTKAVVQAFREQTARPDFRRWKLDLEIRRGESPSSFKVGEAGLGGAAERAERWLALRDAYPEDEVKWASYVWTHYSPGSSDNFRKGEFGLGAISLKLLNTNNFDAVSETYRRLTRDSPDLSAARWELSAQGNGSLEMFDRYPTELELSVWNRLNEDQHPPHRVIMRSIASRPVFDVAVELEFDHADDAKSLADRHLPIITELDTVVTYRATRKILGEYGTTSENLLYTTVGVCDNRAFLPYQVEQALANPTRRC